MSKNRNKVPPMTPKSLAFYIITIILLGLFFFFIRGDLAGKICGCIVCPIIILYMIYAYCKEKKADKNAVIKNRKIMDGSYFTSSEWRTQYISYLNNHPFAKPKYPSMKTDLLMRFRRREYVVGMLFMLFLMLCSSCGIILKNYLVAVSGILLFGFFFFWEFALFMGRPVRKWLNSDIDYNVLEASYRNCKMLTYKKNGFAFGMTHIHAFTEKKVYAINYRLVDGISRKIVRLKKYEDNIYSSEEYQHFAVIHVRLPKSGNIHDVEIELNEFQVQMAIDNLPIHKIGEQLQNNLMFTEKEESVNL